MMTILQPILIAQGQYPGSCVVQKWFLKSYIVTLVKVVAFGQATLQIFISVWKTNETSYINYIWIFMYITAKSKKMSRLLLHIVAIHYALMSCFRVDFDNLLVPLKCSTSVGNTFLLIVLILVTSSSLPVCSPKLEFS